MKIRNLITLLVLVGRLALPMAAQAATPQQPVGIGLYNAASGASYQAQLIVTYSLPVGACQLTTTCASAIGPAKFIFNAQYKKGATIPTGSTKFQFQAGNLTFQSTSYQWLIVNQNGTNAQFKGTGTVNGSGSYTFIIWLTDGSPDTLRIQITDGSGNIVYDNGTQQALAGGSIAIRK